MDGEAPRWVRVGLLWLGVIQIAIGLWALLATRSWFEHFPGIGADLIAAEPPFNAHLAADAGAGFFATGIALVAAAAWPHRSTVYVALLAYLALAIPHFLYHATNPAHALSHGAQAVNLMLQGGGVGLAVLLGWGARPQRHRSTPEPLGTAAPTP